MAVFLLSAGVGVVMSYDLASGPSILFGRWTLVWRLALWAGLWAVAVAAVLRLPRRHAVVLIFTAAAALRLAALGGPPTTSDDIYRYAWDGRVQLAGVDPYAQVPASPRVAAVRETWLWPDPAGCASLHRPAGCTRINRPLVSTIYPPVAEGWFATVYRVGGIGSRHKAWQVAGLVTDLATVGLLVVALRRWRRDVRWAALYALSPVPVFEIVNNGHVDGLAIALVVAALALSTGTASVRRDVGIGLLIGGAALVKVYPALLLVAMIGLPGPRRWLSLLRATTAAVGLALVLYLPHMVNVGWHVLGYLPGYLREENYDRGTRFLIIGVLGLSGTSATVAAVGALGGAIGLVLWRRPDAVRGAAMLLTALFLITTPVQPWYATIVVAVGAVAGWPWWAAVAAAGEPYFFAVILGYGGRVGVGRASYLSASLLVFGALGIERWRSRHSLRARPGVVQTLVDGPDSAVVQLGSGRAV